MMLRPGQQVERYVVESLLGSGGTAEVYAVRHALLGAPAALKVLKMRSETLFERVLREGLVQGRLRHRNVVSVLDLVDVQGAPGLLMERVEGPTLAHVIRGGPLPLPRVQEIARGLMAGLHAAHHLGIVHHDLKPSNVLLAAGDVPRIVDFGLAALAHDADSALAGSGVSLETPAYMAPEQREDGHDVDARADLFALGVVLYEMLCGRLAPRAPVPERVAGVPARIDRAIRWALAPDREERVPSVAALWTAFFGEPFPEGAPEVRVAPAVRPDGPKGSVPSAVPRPVRELVSRGSELETVSEALGARGGLLTLVGTAGVGKTRLANEIAAQWNARRSVCWVELATAMGVQDMLCAVIEQLSVHGRTDGPALGAHLARQGPLLLVLDNFEQLPRAAAEVVGTWVRVALSLRVLVTSRQPLDIVEEQVVPVRPLEVPESLDEVLQSDAWALMVAAAPPGALSHLDGARARRLLASLDGLPLAMELAAARLETLSVEQLEVRMADRFSVLSAPTGSGERHDALYSAIEWSWSLLSAVERGTLAQLSAFVAPFGLELAEALVVLDDLRRPLLLDVLHVLVRRNLVQRAGERFSLLVSIREFAQAQLDDDARRATWVRHAQIHERIASRYLPTSGCAAAVSDLTELVERFADCGAVIERAASCPELRGSLGAISLARCAVFDLNATTEGVLQTAEHALAAGVDIPEDQQVRLRIWRANALRHLGHLQESEAEHRRILEGDPPAALLSMVLGSLADLLVDEGSLEEPLALYRRAAAIAAAQGQPNRQALAECGIGVQVWRTSPEEAEASFQRALTVIEMPLFRIEVYKSRAYVRLQLGDVSGAGADYQSLLALAGDLGARRPQLYAVGQIGMIREVQGEYEGAARCLEEIVLGMQEDGDDVFAAIYNVPRGRVLARMGRLQEAATLLERAVAVLAPGAPMRRLAWASLGVLAARACRPDAAATYVAAEEVPEEVRAIVGDVASAFVALDRGDRQPARDVARRISALDVDLVRETLLDLAASELSEAAEAWWITRDGGQVRTPAGETIDLSRYAANARILAHLAHRRLDPTDAGSDIETLAAAGWPGESILPSAAYNRVRVALSGLRRAGLAPLIECTKKRWRLDPGQLVWYPSERATPVSSWLRERTVAERNSHGPLGSP